MLARWTHHLYYALYIASLAAAAREEFREDLVIRPLPDGRVASKFTFTTLLREATPRNPEALGVEDDCKSPIDVNVSYFSP